jgi:hypothetical protein
VGVAVGNVDPCGLSDVLRKVLDTVEVTPYNGVF